MIKNEINYVWIGGGECTILHYLAIKSAHEVNNPSRILFHCDAEPSGVWWDRCREYVEIVPVDAPTEVGGRKLMHPAHRSDVARLNVLRESGGIYLDIDVVCVRPFTPLLTERMVMGQEGDDDAGFVGGLCNAVILVEPNHPFILRWLEGFDPKTSYWQGFRSRGRDRYWSEMSVQYPAFLARKFPDEITVLGPRRFFNPMWYELDLEEFFEGEVDTDDAYCHHLWQSNPWVKEHLPKLTPEYIHTVDSTFNRVARRFV